jgi:hypothetical protein
MSRLSWPIRVVTAEENLPDSCFILGIAADEYGEEGHLIFQCGLSAPDDQARRLELDSYCILNEEGGVYYGGLENVSLSADEISLRFSVEAASELELPAQDIEIEIVESVDMPTLRDGLRRVLTYGNRDKIPRMAGV